MASEVYILESALEVLRQGGTLTIDAVARQADLTKPGVVHHFATKQVLALAVLDHMLDTWEAGLIARVGTDSSPTDRLRAYVEHTLLGEMDSSDLALVADPKLRDQLVERWTSRMQMWFGVSTTPPPCRSTTYCRRRVDRPMPGLIRSNPDAKSCGRNDCIGPH